MLIGQNDPIILSQNIATASFNYNFKTCMYVVYEYTMYYIFVGNAANKSDVDITSSIRAPYKFKILKIFFHSKAMPKYQFKKVIMLKKQIILKYSIHVYCRKGLLILDISK